jgi:uncharacterized protein (TIGR02246 family)
VAPFRTIHVIFGCFPVEALMLHKLIVVLVGFVMLSGCGGGSQETPQATNVPPDPAPLNELRSKFQAAYNAVDAATLAQLYTDDAISLPDHHASVQGKSAIQQYYQDLFKEYGATITITPADTEIVGDLAHEHGTFSITVTPKAGGDAVMDDGKYVVIFKRGADGVWKIHHDIDNSNRMPVASSQTQTGKS